MRQGAREIQAQTTIDFIVKESFRLFAKKRYEQVTVTDMERATKLTRGSIFYYLKNKEHLFEKILEKYIFNQNFTSNCDRKTLLSFINSFVDQIKSNKELMNSLGIKNADFAYTNISNQAVYFYPEYISIIKEKNEKELITWVEVVQSAILSGEISNSANTDTVANIFYHLYAGFSYNGILLPDGIDLEKMHNAFMEIYNMIKK